MNVFLLVTCRELVLAPLRFEQEQITFLFGAGRQDLIGRGLWVSGESLLTERVDQRLNHGA